jgi:hypothetical protein
VLLRATRNNLLLLVAKTKRNCSPNTLTSPSHNSDMIFEGSHKTLIIYAREWASRHSPHVPDHLEPSSHTKSCFDASGRCAMNCYNILRTCATDREILLQGR